MTLKTVPLASIDPPKDNPRRNYDKASIEGLALSIKQDGILQNLVVEPRDTGRYRVVSGKRRYLALTLLKKKGEIDEAFRVPVEVRKNLAGEEALRLATVENVQREALDPIDEAEAFALILKTGGEIEDVAANTGLSRNTIGRRLALANLCAEVKAAVRAGEIPLGIAEALTMGSEEQQKQILAEYKEGAEFDHESVRDMLLGEKPSAAIAIFPLSQYTGSYTRDLFSEEERTFFDDTAQFFALQKAAVEELAASHRPKAAFVDVFESYSPPWWQYRDAEKGEAKGVVINCSPTGRVEVRTGLVRHEVNEAVVEETKESPQAPKREDEQKKSDHSASLVRYAALHRSAIVQGSLLRNPRKRKEVAAVELLLAFGPKGRIKIELHPCVRTLAEDGMESKAFEEIRSGLQSLFAELGLETDGNAVIPACLEGKVHDWLPLYMAVGKLADERLDELLVRLVLLSFGAQRVDRPESAEDFLPRVARDLGVSLREWWTPNEEFLALLRKSELEAIAIDSGANYRLGKLKDYTKKRMVESLAGYFAKTADPSAALDEHDAKGRSFVPDILRFIDAGSPPQEQVS